MARTGQRSRSAVPAHVQLALPVAAFAPVVIAVFHLVEGDGAAYTFHDVLMWFLFLSLPLAAILLLVGRLAHARKAIYLPAYVFVVLVTISGMCLGYPYLGSRFHPRPPPAAAAASAHAPVRAPADGGP